MNFDRFGYTESFLDNSNNTPLYIIMIILSVTFSLAVELFSTYFLM
jgi:hypothetical protein